MEIIVECSEEEADRIRQKAREANQSEGNYLLRVFLESEVKCSTE